MSLGKKTRLIFLKVGRLNFFGLFAKPSMLREVRVREISSHFESFRRILTNISERLARESGKNLMKGIKQKLYSVRKDGALAPIKVKLPLASRSNNNQE